MVDCEEESNLGAYESLSTLEDMQSLLDREQVERFVTKPVHGTRGQNISVWETIDGEIRRHDGTVLSSQNFGKLFSYGYRGQDALQFLLQRRIEPSVIAADYPTRCPLSFRVITLIDNDDQIQVLYCYLKIPAPNEVVDNVSQGGYVAPLDDAAQSCWGIFPFPLRRLGYCLRRTGRGTHRSQQPL